MKRRFQNLGRSLMQPVAVLPLAALLLGIGYMIDPEAWGGNNQFAAFLIKSGGAVLDNLGIIFAVGVAFGLSRDGHGAGALAGLVSFMTLITLLGTGAAAQLKGLELEAWQASAPMEVAAFDAIGMGNAFIGILAGIIGASAYNKFYQVKLPDFLAFFSGRRLVPIMASIISMLVALVLLFVWPVVYVALAKLGQTLLNMGPIGAGIYGFFNRLLIPTGLHHALNQVFWFGLVDINDIPNFLSNAQDTITATYHPGMYQAGFFPIMMFGLPAAGYAMYKVSKPERKKAAKSLLLAAGLASFLTGVTEPMEFAFMFLAPQLYVIHALLTGVSVFLAAQFGWYAGFGFSAGLFDLILSMANPMAENWYMLLILGVIFGIVYYLVFRYAIPAWDLKTPGREDDEAHEGEGRELPEDTDYTELARVILEGVGGKENVTASSYCITRLRLEVADENKVDEEAIRKAKVAGIVRPSKKQVQVIIGPQVQAVYDEFIKLV